MTSGELGWNARLGFQNPGKPVLDFSLGEKYKILGFLQSRSTSIVFSSLFKQERIFFRRSRILRGFVCDNDKIAVCLNPDKDMATVAS